MKLLIDIGSGNGNTIIIGGWFYLTTSKKGYLRIVVLGKELVNTYKLD